MPTETPSVPAPAPSLRQRLEAHATECRAALARGDLRPRLPQDLLNELQKLRNEGARAYLARADLAGAYLARADLAGANLAGANLAGAYLAGANLADAYLADAYLADADLADADLADANLADANLAGADLADANLARADLADADLAGANLAGADLADANLARADLAGANLAGANLAGAYLAGANLAGAYLAGARGVAPAAAAAEPAAEPKPRQTREEWLAQRPKNARERMLRYRQDHPDVPVVENLDSKILAAVTSGGGSLDMSKWHQCETTHCRAGWAIQLAGKAGQDLEAKLGPHHAGAAIYRASTGKVPHFFATTASALEDIRACAAREAEAPAS